MTEIYLDHAATTYVHEEVVQAMLPFMQTHYGNPSSIHQLGQFSRRALENAREEIALLLNCENSTILFTSGGTESNNTSIFGVTFAQSIDKRHVVTTAIEHHSVLHACEQLERIGGSYSIVPVDESGMVSLEAIQKAVTPQTSLISVMMGNNEIGTLQPIREIGEWARSQGITFHVDGVQALGWESLSLSELPIDLASFSGHKIHGPKGIGILYIAKHLKFLPLIYGGSQERKRRAGTENVSGIIGFAKALAIVTRNLTKRATDVKRLRDHMWNRLNEHIQADNLYRNGQELYNLPHILNVSLKGVDTETLLMNLDLRGIYASSGSACTSGSFEPSHVLKALNLSEDRMKSAIRFSFSDNNTMQEVEEAVKAISQIHERIILRRR